MKLPRCLAGILFTLAMGASALGTFVQGDMNGDLCADFVTFNPTTRATQYMLMHASHYVTTAAGRTLPVGMKLVAIADLNGDGIMDYVMVSSDRKIVYGLRDGNGSITTKLGPLIPWNYDVIASADMNRDGAMDFILFNPYSRTTVIMLMNPVNAAVGWVTARQTVYAIAAVDPGYRLVAVADFDKDGIPDLVFAGGTGHATLVFFMQGVLGNALKAVGVAPSGINGFEVVGVGDFNSDKQQDLVLTYSPGSGHPTQTEFLYLNLAINKSTNRYTFTNLGAFVAGPSIPAGWTLVSP